MRLTWFPMASIRRPALAGLVLAAMFLFGSASSGFAQAAQGQAAAPAKPTLAFTNDAGVILVYVKSEKTADFEELMNKFKEALTKSEAPEAKQQAAGLKVFKAPNGPAPQGAALYVLVADPIVKEVEYWFLSILYKAFPTEAQALYTKWTEAKAATNPVIFDLATAVKMQ
jgi:hypothetical protein